jgi:dihydrofolate synthase/folylpolyglutamate synthase
VREALRENDEFMEDLILPFDNPGAAYAYASERAGVNDRICIFGSFHTVAEVLRNRDMVGRG